MTHLQRNSFGICRLGCNMLMKELKRGIFLRLEFLFCSSLTTSRKYTTSEYNSVVKSPYPDIKIPKKKFFELIWSRHHKWRHYTAVECGHSGLKYTYSELLQRSEKIGKGLLYEGLNPGDVVAFLLPNMPDFIAAILGAAKVGLTICSINPLYTPNEIAYQIENSNAKCIITFPHKLNDALNAIKELNSSRKNHYNIKVILAKGFEGKGEAHLTEVKFLDEIMNFGENENGPVQVATHPMSYLAFISHSSGTTGLPKGVALTHKNVTASILQMAHPSTTCFRKTTDLHQDVIPMVLPIFHNYALEIVLVSLYHGSKIITLTKFEEESFLFTLKHHKVTMLFTVPPMMLFLASKDTASKEHLKHLRLIFCAAAPIGVDDIERTMKKAPLEANFIQGYGQTEAMCCLTHVPYGSKDYKSVGVPLVNTEMRVVDVDNGTSKEAFQNGEICFRGPQMSDGYLNDAKKTNESIDKEGWFHTGDIGYYDNNSNFYIVDRIKDMIKVKGFQVAPAELEAVLRNHPAVEDAGVAGISDEKKGEAPVGFIKIKPNLQLTETDLKKFLSGKVAPFKMIEKFFFVDSIPKTPSGKILRKELKHLCKSLNLEN